MVDNLGENSMRRDDLGADDDEINPETVWKIKGPSAPSAIKMSRRAEVLDVMGISRQLVYPNFALIGVMLSCNPDAHKWFGYDPAGVDRQQLGRDVIAGHNDWVLRTVKEVDSDRVRPVALILTESLEQMMADTQQLIDGGVRVLMFPGGEPPAGMSPADERLDPWWKLVSDANIPVTLHIGTEFPFLASNKWSSRVPQFKRADFASLEFPVEPYFGATMKLHARELPDGSRHGWGVRAPPEPAVRISGDHRAVDWSVGGSTRPVGEAVPQAIQWCLVDEAFRVHQPQCADWPVCVRGCPVVLRAVPESG